MEFLFLCSTWCPFNHGTHFWAIELDTQSEIPYLCTPMYYSLVWFEREAVKRTLTLLAGYIIQSLTLPLSLTHVRQWKVTLLGTLWRFCYCKCPSLKKRFSFPRTGGLKCQVDFGTWTSSALSKCHHQAASCAYHLHQIVWRACLIVTLVRGPHSVMLVIVLQLHWSHWIQVSAAAMFLLLFIHPSDL